MTNPTTAAEWQAIPEDKCGVALAKVLTSRHGPFERWEHEIKAGSSLCQKCGERNSDDPCSIPDPIDINDWNVAMEWKNKVNLISWFSALVDVWFAKTNTELFSEREVLFDAQPRHYLIAAALVAGRN